MKSHLSLPLSFALVMSLLSIHSQPRVPQIPLAPVLKTAMVNSDWLNLQPIAENVSTLSAGTPRALPDQQDRRLSVPPYLNRCRMTAAWSKMKLTMARLRLHNELIVAPPHTCAQVPHALPP